MANILGVQSQRNGEQYSAVTFHANLKYCNIKNTEVSIHEQSLK